MSAPEIDYRQILESPYMTVGWLRSMVDTLIRDASRVIDAADAGEIENIYPVRDLRWMVEHYRKDPVYTELIRQSEAWTRENVGAEGKTEKEVSDETDRAEA